MVFRVVSIRKIEAVITAMNGDDHSGLKGRLQYLNLQRFPPGFRVGKAKRADYGMDEVLAFSLWFSLTQASLTPASALALVKDFWPEFARLFITAASVAGTKDLDVPSDHSTIAVISGNALRSTGSPGNGGDSGPASPFDIVLSRPATLARDLGSGFDARIVIDMESVNAAIGAAMALEPAPVGEDRVAGEVRQFAEREGWAQKVNGGQTAPEPSVRKKVSEARGERLSESDYYFVRALELIDAAPRLQPRDDDHLPPPRLVRTARYLMQPSPREGWKRWVSVEGDVSFYYAAAALIERTLGIDTGVPHTVSDAALMRVTHGTGDIVTIAAAMRSIALVARKLELDQD